MKGLCSPHRYFLIYVVVDLDKAPSDALLPCRASSVISLPSTRGKWEVCVRLIVVLLFSPLLISGNQFGRFLCFKNSTAVPPRLFGSRKRRWLCNFVNFRSYAVWDRNYRQTMDSLLNVRRHECGAEKVNIFTPIMAGRTSAFTSNNLGRQTRRLIH